MGSWKARGPSVGPEPLDVVRDQRNRVEFPKGREQIEALLVREWVRELDDRPIKGIWTFRENRIAARFANEYRDDSGSWFRAYGNEHQEFDPDGLMRKRCAGIDEHPTRHCRA